MVKICPFCGQPTCSRNLAELFFDENNRLRREVVEDAETEVVN